MKKARGLVLIGGDGETAVVVDMNASEKPVTVWEVVEDAVLWRDPADLPLLDARRLLRRVYEWSQTPDSKPGGGFGVFAEEIVPGIAEFLGIEETAVVIELAEAEEFDCERILLGFTK